MSGRPKRDLGPSVKARVLLAVAILALGSAPASAADRPPWRAGKPRLARIYLSGVLPPDSLEARRFREFEILVVSPRLEATRPGMLQALHDACPGSRIFLFYSAADAWADFRSHPWGSFDHRIGRAIEAERLWMPSLGQSPEDRGAVPAVSNWPGRPLVNVPDPRWAAVWSEALLEDLRWLETRVPARLNLVVDNTWDGIAWIHRHPENAANGIRLDPDGDGAAEPDSVLDGRWREGTRRALWLLRDGAGERLVLGNGLNAFTRELDGLMWEDFGAQPWIGVDDLMERAPRFGEGSPERLHIVHVPLERLDYGLAVTLLRDDLYLAVSETPGVHSSLVWDARMDVDLGAPLAEARFADGRWVRPYERGTVRVDPGTLASEVRSVPR